MLETHLPPSTQESAYTKTVRTVVAIAFALIPSDEPEANEGTSQAQSERRIGCCRIMRITNLFVIARAGALEAPGQGRSTRCSPR